MTPPGHVAMALMDAAEVHGHGEDCSVLLDKETRRLELLLEREILAERTARIKAEEERDRLVAEFTAAIATRDDFLAAASHDLKTPLSALQLQIQGALRNAERNGIDQRMAERLKAMNRQVRHLGELVERLLDIPRLTGGKIDLVEEEMDLAELVRDIADRFACDLEWTRCPLTLRASAPVRGRWDRTRLDQVLSNLLSNAIKYGRGAPIEITVDEFPGEPPGARVAVRDHGIGIPPEHKERIFEKFHRAVTNRTASGLGLGLWIARHTVEASGGALSVESTPGQGSTFTVILPLAPPGR